MLALAALAHAEPAADAAPCGGYWIVGTQPAVEQTGVALDAPLRIQLSDNGCPGGETLAVQLLDAGGAPVQEWSLTADDLADSKGVLTLDPTADLAPLSAYTLQATLSTAEQVVVPFTTGDEGLSAGSGAPILSYLEAWGDCVGGASVSWTLDAAADPQGAALLELRRGAEVVARALPSEGSSGYAHLGDVAGEICLTPVQIDGLGAESAGEEACAEVQEPDCNGGTPGRGCSTAGGLALLAPALLAALGLRRKAR